MNPKSEIKLKAAIHKMNTVMPIPNGPDECKYGTWNGVKKYNIIDTRYSIIIEKTMLPITLLKVGVGLIILEE